MNGLVRDNNAPWFNLSYNADGSVLARVKVLAYIQQCTFFKITYGSGGFVAVPFSEPVDEFFIGWSLSPMIAGEERSVQIGGFIGSVRLPESSAQWLVVSNGEVVGVESKLRPASAFGFVGRTLRVLLFPVMVREVKNDAH